MTRRASAHPRPPAQTYEVRVRGHLGETTLGAFPALRADTAANDTLLTGAVADQVAGG